jgi:hypothetical protein
MMTHMTAVKIGFGLLTYWLAFGSEMVHSQTNVPTTTEVRGQLLDFQMKSKDRMIIGAVEISDNWKATDLRFVNVTTGQDLGTYYNVLENLSATKPTFKIYNHQIDIYAGQDVKDAKKDPAIIEQKVVFYKDDNDPKLLHFATTFDDVGVVQVQILQNGRQVAYGQAKLTADAAFSALINTVDNAISGPPSPIIDPTDPNDPHDSSNSLGLLVVEQPGSLAEPGAIDLKKTDPKALVLSIHQGTTSPSVNDADLVLITLRRPLGLLSNTGTITLSVSNPTAIMLFNADGTKALADYSVDLAHPSGDLVALGHTNAQVWVRGAAAADNIAFTYTYTDASGKIKNTDQVNLSVKTP